ncbi:Serine protease 56 [Smittium mucronatum]|uniref:Serine protease 56 n=1 Tax=Smittium mucronatum TaxID=133383 RepID=A0A1R0H2F1_9FUNG|nr:Serine protease 56 [Smittium mucronatum]
MSLSEKLTVILLSFLVGLLSYVAPQMDIPYSHNKLEVRIVNGDSGEIKDFPYLVFFYSQLNEKDVSVCAGSLISNNFVLTAAHCFYNNGTKIKIDSVYISAGSEFNTKKSPNKYIPDEITIHEDFDDETNLNDIAIVKLNKNASFANLTFAKLYKDIPESGDELKIAGWGKVSPEKDSKFSETFNVVKLEYPAQNSCDSSFKTKLNNKTSFCTFNKDGKGICQGDSGGPIVYSKLKPPPIIGITSSTITSENKTTSCGRDGDGSMFTSIIHYFDWIEVVTGLKKQEFTYSSDDI